MRIRNTGRQHGLLLLLGFFIMAFFACPSQAKALSEVRYINQHSRVRDQHLNPIGYKYRGDRIVGRENGSYFEFYEGGLNKKVHKSLVTSYPVEATAYVKGLTNVRSLAGEVIGKIGAGGYINGISDGRFIYFDYKGKKAKIYMSTANIGFSKPKQEISVGGRKNGLMSLYVTGQANVRDISTGKVIDIKYRGTNLVAYKSGAYHYFEEDGKVRKIHSSLLTSIAIPSEIYTASGVNLRRVENASILTTLRKGERVKGIATTDYIYTIYNGKLARVYSEYTSYKLMSRYYVKADANVRDSKGNIIELARKGKAIYGERIGDYYRYFEAGRYKYIWHTLLSSQKVYAPKTLYEEYILSKGSHLLYSSTGKGYKYTGSPTMVSAKSSGSYLYFTYEGKNLKVIKDRATPSKYQLKRIIPSTNIRDLDLNKIYTTSISKEVRAYRYNASHYLFYENGNARLVHSSRVSGSNTGGKDSEITEIIKMVLDPGHGEGKAHNRGGVIFNEGDQNYQMSKLFIEEASKYVGLETINTRKLSSDDPILSKRAEIGNEANIFISLHTNAAGSSARGVEIYGSMDNKETQFPKEMARYISDTLNTPNRGVKYRTYNNSILKKPNPNKTDYWGVFRGNSAEEKYLIEFVFHTNYQDSKSLLQNRDRLVKGMVEMIANHFNLIKVR